MLITITMYSIIAVLIVFIIIGLILTVSAVRTASRYNKINTQDERRLTLSERVRRYEGHIKPGMPLLNPAARVGIEFISAVCGFPGLGWLISGNVFIGLVLISIVPGFVWAFFPVYAFMTEAIAVDPFAVARYLPILALVSSTGLAIHQSLTKQKQGVEDDIQG